MQVLLISESKRGRRVAKVPYKEGNVYITYISGLSLLIETFINQLIFYKSSKRNGKDHQIFGWHNFGRHINTIKTKLILDYCSSVRSYSRNIFYIIVFFFMN